MFEYRCVRSFIRKFILIAFGRLERKSYVAEYIADAKCCGWRLIYDLIPRLGLDTHPPQSSKLPVPLSPPRSFLIHLSSPPHHHYQNYQIVEIYLAIHTPRSFNVYNLRLGLVNIYPKR
jgi:hypothetical protein